MVFNSLVFKEISKNGKKGHGRMFASTATVSGTSVLIISHITFRIVACTVFATIIAVKIVNVLEICKTVAKVHRGSTEVCCSPKKGV